MNLKLKRVKKKKLRKYFASWSRYIKTIKLQRKAIIDSYMFRFRKLAQKTFAGFNYSALIPRKQLIFMIWKKNFKLSSIKMQEKSEKAMGRIMKRKAIFRLKQRIFNKSSLKRQQAKADLHLSRRLLSKVIKIWKKYQNFNQTVQEFIIKRVKLDIKRLIKIWNGKRLRSSRVKYFEYKSSGFRDNYLLRKAFEAFKFEGIKAKKIRKLEFFWVLWKKVHRIDKKILEDFTLMCRKRHLTNFYFKVLKKFMVLSKDERKADNFYLKSTFRRVAKAIKDLKIRKKNIFKRSSEIWKQKMRKLVRDIKASKYLAALKRFMTNHKRKKRIFSLACKFYKEKVLNHLKKSVFTEWKTLPIINLVEKHRNLKNLEKTFMSLKKNQILSKQNHKKSEIFSNQSLCQKYFRLFQLNLIPRILNKSKAKLFRKTQRKKSLLSIFKKYHIYKTHKKGLNKFDQYEKTLKLKVLISLKLRSMKKAESRCLHSKIRWKLFDRKYKMIQKTFTYWKFLHRTRLILIAQVYEKYFSSLAQWKTVLDYPGLPQHLTPI